MRSVTMEFEFEDIQIGIRKIIKLAKDSEGMWVFVESTRSLTTSELNQISNKLVSMNLPMSNALQQRKQQTILEEC